METVQKANQEHAQSETPITDAVASYLNEIEQYRTLEPAKYLRALSLLVDQFEQWS